MENFTIIQMPKGATGIFGHTDSPNLPDDCISLRFTRIDCMTKDLQERDHIDNAIKKLAQKLLKCNKINNDFAQMLFNYIPTYKGYYTLAIDEIDCEFHKPQHRVLMDFGPLDYYIACFSIEPNNEYIINKFKSSVCIIFNTEFSQNCMEPFAIDENNFGSYGNIIDLNTSSYPISSIRTCYCSTYLRRVEYVDINADTDKIQSDLLEKRLTIIYRDYMNIRKKSGENVKLNLETIINDIEDMYSLCDAFVKDIKFKEEKEVRFVIRLPQREYFMEKYGEYPILLINNHFLFDTNKTYLQLPISTKFITL